MTGTSVIKELIFFVKNKRSGRKDSLRKTMEMIYFFVCLHITIICANLCEHFRSNPLGLFLRKGVLKICSKSTGEHPCRSVISMRLLCNFIEITFWHGYSPLDFLYIFRTPFYKNIWGGLLLKLVFLEINSQKCLIN